MKFILENNTNHKKIRIKKKKKKKKKIDGSSLKRLRSLELFLDLAPEMKNSIVGIYSD